MRLDTGGLEILDEETCRVLLGAARLGRIVFTHRALPAVQPVNYTVADGDVVVCTSGTSRLATAAGDAVVAFEIDAFDADARTGWSVVVVGVARRVQDRGELAHLHGLGLRPWVPGDRDVYLRITPQIVSGRRILPAQ